MTGFPRRGPNRRVAASLLTGATLLLLCVSGAHAQTLGPQVSVNIVEPKDQAKWGYAPATKRVAPGTWVTWSNNGQDEHTVTALDGSFDSSTLEPSEGFSWYFDQPGTRVTYTCTLHPWMAGTIVVSGDPLPPPTDDPPPDDGTV
jgi:plastocyanin